MTFIPDLTGVISTQNSSNVQLATDAIFTGTWEEILEYASISILGLTDQNGTLYAQFSTDSVNIIHEMQLSSGDDTTLGVHSLIPISKYFRIKHVNGSGGSTTTFKLQVLYHTSSRVTIPTSKINQQLLPYSDVLNTRSVTFGLADNGDYKQVNVNNLGHLKMDISTPISSFGDILTTNLTPIVQLGFLYNIHKDLVITNTTGSGTVTQSYSNCVVQTTSQSTSSASMYSKRYVKYRPGQGIVIRFTGEFTTGVSGSVQLIGCGDDTNGIFFGYNGVDFGLLRRNNGVDDWTYQTSWSIDVVDGSGSSKNLSKTLFTPTNGNVFQIQYQWSGFGSIKFSIGNNDTSNLELVHIITHTNSNATELSSHHLMTHVENTTNTTNMVVKTSAMGAFLEGNIALLGPTKSISNNKGSIPENMQGNILTIKSNTLFQGVINKTPILPLQMSLSTDNLKPTIFSLILNATLSGSVSYTDIDTNTSCVSYDVDGIIVSGGKVVSSYVLSKNSSQNIDISGLHLELLHGDTLTICAKTSNITNDIYTSITWLEDF